MLANLQGRFIGQGERIPKYWGISYRCWDRYGGVAHPVPINILVRWGRNVWFYLCGFYPSYMDKRFQKYYEAGSAAATAIDSSRRVDDERALRMVEKALEIADRAR